MKKKEFLSLLLALLMIISTMIPVKAEGTTPEMLEDKTMEGWSELQSTGDGTTTVVAPSDSAARTGDWSLCVTFQAGTTGYREYIQNTDTQVTLEAGTTYKLGYWYQYYAGMASTGNAKPFIAIGDENGSFTVIRDIHAFQTKPADGGWRECIGTDYTPEEDITGYISFGFNVTDLAAGSTILIDDIYIRAVGSDENLIPNPSFEETVEAPETPEQTMEGWSELQSTGDGTTTVVSPSEEAARTGDQSLSVTFQAGTTGYKEYIQNTSVQVTLKAGVEYELGYWYQYYAGMASTGNAKPFIAIGEVTDSSKVTIGAFSADKPADGGWRQVYASGNFIPEEDMTGYVSFGFNVTALAVGSTILIDDIYIRAVGSDENLIPNPSFEETWEAPETPEVPEPPVTPDEPPVDEFSPEILTGQVMVGWGTLIDSEGVDKGVRVGPTNYDSKSGEYSLCAIFPNIKVWQKEYFKNSNTQITLEAGKTYKFGVWYKTSDNITKQHQSWPFFAVGSVDNLWDLSTTESETVDGWKHRWGTVTPSSNISGYLYFGFDPNFSHITDQTEVKYLFDDIYFCEEGSDVNPIYNAGFEELSVDTNLPDFEISAPKLYKGNTKVEAIEFGTYKIQTKVRNNKLDTSVPIIQMVALYKGNILKSLVSAETTAGKLEPSDSSTTLDCVIEVPSEDSEQYHLEVFIWDSKAGMKSLYDFVTFE